MEPAATCSVCRDLDRTVMPDFKQRMIARDDLYASVSAADICHTCALLWIAVREFYDWNRVVQLLLDFDIVPGTLTIWPFDLDNLSDGRIKQDYKIVLYSHEGMCSRWSDIIGVAPGSTIPLKDAEIFKKAKRWLKDCRSNHQKCENPMVDYVPTRLIDVGNERTDPKLHITNGALVLGGYLALSHCWGPPNLDTKKLELTRKTLESFQKGIPFDDFPKNFRDAVIATRKLGYQYLWVDSLCIIQHDVNDWAIEAAQMCSVYQNSVLTIAADQAPNSNHGFLETYNDMGKSVHFMEFANLTGKKDTIFARKFRINPTLETLGCYKEEQKSHLDSRAWTFQERILSPRILHFGAFEMTWECNECTTCECELKSSDSYFKKDFVEFVQDGQSVEDCTKLWKELTRQFSARNITYSTDRLPAIGGLADALGQVYPDKYLAGHWKGGLEKTLLWRAQETYEGQVPNLQTRRHENYYAPSWSWASVTGHVVFLGGRAKFLWSVEDAACTLACPNTFGPVTEGHVIVRGPLARIQVIREKYVNKRINQEQVRHLAISTAHPTIKRLAEIVFPDIGPEGVELDNEKSDFYVLFGAIEGSPGYAMGLLLQAARHREGVFERVGLVVCERQQWRNWEAVTTIESVTIV